MLPSLVRYRRHLRETADWIVRSERPTGGSAAYYAPALGWSRAYPETTGYLIPTLLRLSDALGDATLAARAERWGEWLLDIRNDDGSWNGLTHPPRAPARPSIFNTGQILKGMTALWERTGDARWLDAASAATAWLRRGMGADGLWEGKDYRSQGTPSYYTHVLWPMLEVAVATGDADTRAAVERGLTSILARRLPNGVIRGWAFAADRPAFTHTIAYAIRGIQECARLLDRADLHEAVRPALEKLLRRAELAGGNLPGAFDEAWTPAGRYVCLTGNAQVAACLLILEGHEASQGRPDLRLVSGAARLLDVVCRAQRLGAGWPAGVRGAVAGSAPLTGPYMRLRYPNWAAKYLCDGLLRLSARIAAEPLARSA